MSDIKHRAVFGKGVIPIEESFQPLFDQLHVHVFQELIGNRTETALQIKEHPLNSDQIVTDYVLRSLKRHPKRSLQRTALVTKQCPFCKVRLISVEHIDRNEEDEEFADIEHTVSFLEYCQRCQYWRWHRLENWWVDRGGFYLLHDYVSYLSKIKEFTDALPEGCSSELAQALRRYPTKYHSINPQCLERFVADVFKANHTDAEVIHVGKPNDGGVDVLFIDNGNNQWLIQVKRRERPDVSEPVETIRNLLGAMVLQDSTYGIVVSTADHFTYRAYEAVSRARERGMMVELIDRGKLDRMLDTLLPDRPWINMLRVRHPDLVSYFEEKIPSITQSKTRQPDASEQYKQLRFFKRTPK
jgi:hypothetical protein